MKTKIISAAAALGAALLIAACSTAPMKMGESPIRDSDPFVCSTLSVDYPCNIP